MRKRYVGVTAVVLSTLLLAGTLVKSSVLGDEHYRAPVLELWEGQQDYTLTQGITYDPSRYVLSVDDLGGFDINTLGTYTVGYRLTPIAPEGSQDAGTMSAWAHKLVPRAAAQEVAGEAHAPPDAEQTVAQQATPSDVSPPADEPMTLPDVSPPADEQGTPPDAAQTADEQGTPPDTPQTADEQATPPDMPQTEDEQATSPDMAQTADEQATPPDTAQTEDEQGTSPDAAQTADEQATPPDTAQTEDEQGTLPDRSPPADEQGTSPDTAQTEDEQGTSPDVSPPADEQATPPDVSPPADEQGAPPILDENTPLTFVREVVVKPAVTYENQRLDMGQTDLLAGITVLTEGYDITVTEDGGFDPAVIDEYQITYTLHNPSGDEVRQFSRYVQVTRPGVQFYAPDVVAEGEVVARDWTEDIEVDRDRYTLTLLTQPDFTTTAPQRLLYRLDERVTDQTETAPTEQTAEQTQQEQPPLAPSDALVSDQGEQKPTAQATIEQPPLASPDAVVTQQEETTDQQSEGEQELTQATTGIAPTEDTRLAAIFGRDIFMMNITDHVILFDTPDLVLTIDQLEGMSLADLLQGVTATDENGEVVQVELAPDTELVMLDPSDEGQEQGQTTDQEPPSTPTDEQNDTVAEQIPKAQDMVTQSTQIDQNTVDFSEISTPPPRKNGSGEHKGDEAV